MSESKTTEGGKSGILGAVSNLANNVAVAVVQAASRTLSYVAPEKAPTTTATSIAQPRKTLRKSRGYARHIRAEKARKRVGGSR